MKKIFKNEQYRLVLNYDTHGRKCFNFLERLALHSAISYRLFYEDYKELPHELAVKVLRILNEISDNKYKEKEIRYKELPTGHIIEINEEL